jgi:hypothetical protein
VVEEVQYQKDTLRGEVSVCNIGLAYTQSSRLIPKHSSGKFDVLGEGWRRSLGLARTTSCAGVADIKELARWAISPWYQMDLCVAGDQSANDLRTGQWGL